MAPIKKIFRFLDLFRDLERMNAKKRIGIICIGATGNFHIFWQIFVDFFVFNSSSRVGHLVFTEIQSSLSQNFKQLPVIRPSQSPFQNIFLALVFALKSFCIFKDLTNLFAENTSSLQFSNFKNVRLTVTKLVLK